MSLEKYTGYPFMLIKKGLLQFQAGNIFVQLEVPKEAHDLNS